MEMRQNRLFSCYIIMDLYPTIELEILCVELRIEK